MTKSKPIGEREIIDIIRDRLDVMPKMPIPFGDDVSAFYIGSNTLAVLKTDMLVGKTDVPKGMSLRQAARKAVVTNVSDFAAKGVQPLALLVSLGLPRTLTRKDFGEIGEGLSAGAREYGAYVIGGDTGEASDLVISISLFGTAKRGNVSLRSGAVPGDVVAVTGFFGKPPSGLKLLLGKFRATARIREILVDSVLMPRARLHEGLALIDTRAVNAAIDSSDGLAWSLHEIARASNVGFLIDRLPIAAEVEEFAEANGLDAVELALHGGEEYELLLTLKPRLWTEAQETVEAVGGRLIQLGRATADKRVLLKTALAEKIIEPRGYEHFIYPSV